MYLLMIVNVLAFTFVAYTLAGVLAESLKNSKLLGPIALSMCSITIAFHLHQSGVWEYIIAAFAGFFLHTCANGYTKKIKAPTRKNKPKVKVVNINP